MRRMLPEVPHQSNTSTKMPGLFFTGTDTGVGKTYVMSAVARILRQQGKSVSVRKPVATGAYLVEGSLVSEDTMLLAAAVGKGRESWKKITPWTFAEPAAPPVAARLEDVRLELHKIVACVRAGKSNADVCLVEGVGGLLCPLTERHYVADLIARLGMATVVVTRRSLGTINHTLLTLEAAQARGIRVAGIVVNEINPPDGLAEETNVRELCQRTEVPLLAVVSFDGWRLPEGTPRLAGVNWWQLAMGS